MHVAVEEEITNNHGRLKRFIPEAQIQDKVCIYYHQLIPAFSFALQKCQINYIHMYLIFTPF